MRHFYGFVGLPNHWADDNDFLVGDKFFEDKEYVDYYFDNFFEMDKIFGHENSAFGTRGLPVGHPNRTSKSFDRYNERFGPAIVRVIKKDDLTENIHRLKDEPFVVEIVDGLYKWDEGWNRLIALMKLYEQGKISEIKGKSFVAHPA